MTTEDGNTVPCVIIPFPQRAPVSMAGQVLTIVNAAKATSGALNQASQATHSLVDSGEKVMALAREAEELKAIFADLKRDLERLRHYYA